MHLEYTVIEGDFVNAGSASSSIKKTLKQLNVSPSIIKRVVVALYEAEVNAIAHAYGGVITADISSNSIVISVADKGPGIPDIDWAMQEGNSTASPEVRDMGFGAGMGLPNIKKNVDRLDVQSTVGVGTTVTMEVNIC
ncbi:MAG: ATP-binding protein [Bacteroidales bacterium]|nr:anti-sigma regulatory factor [Lentimicrobiaceae bacterium]MBQ2906443.1 ATP-binding protein [Bacteroidales bacterium]MBQ3594595.1 ATP-binding protein [Bacteroidales bacterium]MBR3914926.1 ATP-binding protein [Bacteroidales bacterium]